MQGSELRAIRRAAGLTQAEFGKALHVSGPYIGEMERGEKAVPPATAELARLRFGQRVDVGTFGDKFVAVVSGPMPGHPGRVHRVVAPAHASEAEAIAAAKALAAANPGWHYVARSASK
jgi:transcriptional regulator with XRE-family HTH domain